MEWEWIPKKFDDITSETTWQEVLIRLDNVHVGSGSLNYLFATDEWITRIELLITASSLLADKEEE